MKSSMRSSIRKHLFRNIIFLLSIIIAQLIAAYFGLAAYYRNAFEYGTWINGIYCTGKSIEEVNRELSGKFEYDGIVISDKDGNTYQIAAGDIDFQYDFAEALKLYQDRQNPWLWVDSLWKIRNEKITPVIYYREEKLESCLAKVPFLTEYDVHDRKIAIIKTNQGYELLNERESVLDTEEAKQAVIAAIENAETSVSLLEAGAYHDMELTGEMQNILHEWELVEDFQDCRILYQMGEELVPVDASVVCDWILLDENGGFALDEQGSLQLREDAVTEFIDKLAEEYDTVGKTREFLSTGRGVVVVEGGIYGNRLDKKAETAYLTEAFLNKADEIHIPAYLQMAAKQGKDDIGNTYVEVDMNTQMMYYYLNGSLQIETPIVTGNTSRRMGTPTGVNYVYAKQKNRVLRGPGYASHVNFWMPVKGNIGIHDASWRSSYGGAIYQTNGSHGCINTPYDAMAQMYDMVEIGTPVVMFY